MTKDHDWPENPEGVLRGSREPRGKRQADMPLVSVVIPCYNQAHFLGEAIESVLAQSYQRFEVIVVDDGSTDDTAEVAARYPKVRCVRQQNQGLAAARNTGLRHSEGEYVVFLDADDRLLPEALKTGLECLETHPECAYVYGHFRMIASDGSFLKHRKRLIVSKNRYVGMLRRNYIAMHATVMYRRAIFESVGGFDTSLDACEDYDIYLRITRRFPVCSHERVVAEYRWHGTNMSDNPTLMLSTSVSVLRSQLKHVRGHKQYEEAYRDGIRARQLLYGDRLVAEVRAHMRERKWKRAIRGASVLLRYYPRGLTLLLSERRMERHMERNRLAFELLAPKQELEVHEQRLKELESTMVKEPQEVERLKQHIHRLERQIQNLDQQARQI